jgi:mannose-6-phosphate isomerase-like protein (cupin superfamily)
MQPTNRTLLAGAILYLAFSTSYAADLRVTPSNKVIWLDTPFGVQASPVMGDFSKGKHITFIKFKAGTSTPAHVHTHDYVGIVVRGRGVHYVPSNKRPTALRPGSTWTVPANVEHISGCLKGEDCVFALYQDEPFDYIESRK